MQQPDVPPPPAAPQAPPSPDFVRVTVGDIGDPQAILRGFRAQRDELAEQLRSAENLRESIVEDIRQSREQGLDLTGLNNRLAEVDKRIASIDQQIASAELEVARATAVPGAIPQEPKVVYRNGGGDEEGAFAGGFAFCLALMVPYLLWRRRRRQKRGPAIAAPADERLRSIEQSVEAIAVEMERIGEGQRFMSRLFTERGGLSALGEGAAQPVGVPARERTPQTPR